jgi:hypothetical protein
MSLVVAQATENGPRIVSDTRVTFEWKRPTFKTGTLKAIVLSPTVTICFAGDVLAGLEGVRDFARALTETNKFDELLPNLQKRTVAGQRRVEFILASVAAGSSITRIRDAEIERKLDSAWIGDHDAFERFQEERQKPLKEFQLEMMNQLPASGRVMMALGNAMQAVIADPRIPSVDDFCVRIAAKDGEFNYLEQMFIHVGRDITVKAGDDLVSKMAQPIQEGGYAVSVVEPAKPGTPALGLNFPRARIGLVYLPLQYDEAQVIEDVSPNEFSQVVQNRFGVALRAPMLRHP